MTDIEIKDGKIFNPKTKRWVLIKGATGKKLMASLMSRPDTASEAPMVQPLKTHEISKSVANKVRNEIHESSTHVKNYFSSKQHEELCKTGNWDKVNVPFIHTTSKVTFPMLKIVYKTPAALNGKPKIVTVFDDFPRINQYEYSTNNLLDSVIKELGISNQPDNLDMDWVREQMAYIKNLPKEDLFTLMGYTNQSHNWCNAYLRGIWSHNIFYLSQLSTVDFIKKPFFFPIYFQLKRLILATNRDAKDLSMDVDFRNEILKMRKDKSSKESDLYIKFVKNAHKIEEKVVREALDMYCADLSRIIQNAPRVKKTMTIFRGVRHDIFKETEGKYYKNVGYVSCSFDLAWGKVYMASPSCCLQVVRLLKGAAAIIASPVNSYGGEREVVLDHGTTYFFKKRNAKKLMMLDMKKMCANPTTDTITVSEVVVT